MPNKFFKSLSHEDAQKFNIYSNRLDPVFNEHPTLRLIKSTRINIHYEHELQALEMLIRVVTDKDNVTQKELDQLYKILRNADTFVANEKSVRDCNHRIDECFSKVLFWTSISLMGATLIGLLITCPPAAKLFIDLFCPSPHFPTGLLAACVFGTLAMIILSPIVLLLRCFGVMEKETNTHAPYVYNEDKNYEDFIRVMQELFNTTPVDVYGITKIDDEEIVNSQQRLNILSAFI